MIYLKKDSSLTFSTQTYLKTESDMFLLTTTQSKDVGASFNVTSGEKTALGEEGNGNDPSQIRKLFATKKIGRLHIKNRKKEEVKIQLEITINGAVDVESFKDEDVVIIEKPGHDALNQAHKITLNVKIEPTNKKEIEFNFAVKHWEKVNQKTAVFNQEGFNFGATKNAI